MATPKFKDCNYVFIFKMHTFKILKKLNHIIIFKKYNIQLELASVKPFFHADTYQFMSSQGNVKGHVFKKQAWRPLIFMFYFIPYHKVILYARN